MLVPAWEELLEAEPELAEMFAADPAEGPDLATWLTSCRSVLDRYFTLEDPRRLEPAERELYVETLLESRLLLRGFVDRVDIAPDGAIRVVDYKTGRSPGEMFEGKALFQMKFYALVLWRTRGVLPSMLQLVYLGNGEMVRYVPDEHDLLATERKVEAVWRAIRRAEESGDWQPSPSGCAPGAPTRRSAPPTAALPRRCRSAAQAALVADPVADSRPADRRASALVTSVALDPQRGLGPVGHPDPGERRRQVGLHGPLADAQPAGDLLVGQPVPDQAEHLGLPAGELDLAGSRADAEQRARSPRDGSGDSPRPTARMPVEDVVGVGVLEQVADRAGVEGGDDPLGCRRTT